MVSDQLMGSLKPVHLMGLINMLLHGNSRFLRMLAWMWLKKVSSVRILLDIVSLLFQSFIVMGSLLIEPCKADLVVTWPVMDTLYL